MSGRLVGHDRGLLRGVVLGVSVGIVVDLVLALQHLLKFDFSLVIFLVLGMVRCLVALHRDRSGSLCL